MSIDLTIGYLTGSARVIENHLTKDNVIWRNPRTIGQMFFQPYESTKEFIFCARHTFIPMTLIGLTIINPLVAIVVPAVLGGLAIVCAALGGISKLLDSENTASFFFETATFLIKDLCQVLIDLVVLPLSAVVMVTRGVSTGLQAAGILEHDDVVEDASIQMTF